MKFQLTHKVNELLNLLEQTTGEPGDLTSTLQHIAQTAQTFFTADACIIFAINPITNQFIESLTVEGELLKGKVSFEQPRPDGITQQVLKRELLLVEDLEVTSEYHSRFTRSESIRSFAAFALRMRYNQKPLGVLYLDYRKQRQFSLDEQELLQIFAEQASFLLQEAWLLQRHQEVARIGQEINHELATVDILIQKLREHVVEVLDISHGLLLAVYQPQSNTLDVYLEEQGHSTHLKNDPLQGACQYVIEKQETLFIRQLSKEVDQLPFQPVDITRTNPEESLIFVPLVLRGVSLGVLSIQHSQPNAYTQEDLFILQMLANHIALALYNIRLYDDLSKLNETGQLLTQQLESEQVLQATADKILDATMADIVVLYPYESSRQRFLLPPRIAGTLRNSTPESMFPMRDDDIAALMLHRTKSIFAKESDMIYAELHGDIHIKQGSFTQRENVRSTAAVPLKVGDESVGVLFVNFRQPQRFDAPQKLFINGLASYAAIAIKNAQEFGTLSQRHVRELEILQHIDRELNRNLDLDSVLNTLLRLAHELVSAEEASILLYNAQTQALETAAAIGRHAETSRTQIISLQTKGITRWVVEHKKPARVDNVRRDLPWKNLHYPVASDIISELDVPLLDDDEVVGVLNFESIREGAFSQEDQDLLLTLAGQTVLAIKKAQAYEREKYLYERQKRLAAEAQALNEISKEIISQLDFTRVFDVILERALKLTNSTTGTFELYDSTRHDLWMAAERGVSEDKKGERLSLDQGVVGYVARHQELQNVDPSQPPWNKFYIPSILGTRSELAVPMLEENDLRGVLNVESPLPHHFDESDQRLLLGLADLAVVALQNAEHYKKAEREAQRFQLLYRVGQELSKITEWEQLEQVYDLILQFAVEHSQCQVVIRRYDDNTEELVVVCASQHQQIPPFQRMKLDEGLNGYVAREQYTIVIRDTNNPPSDIPLKLSDPTMRSLVITPINFSGRYYGNLGLSHQDIDYFQEMDVNFFEGLAQLLASTIYRLEITQARQEAELIGSIGQSAFEVTHQLANDLGLVESYVGDIQLELETQHITNTVVSKKLEKIARAVRKVLDVSRKLKHEVATSSSTEASVVMSPKVVLEEVLADLAWPPTIQFDTEIDDNLASVRVIPGSVNSILNNLFANAVQAMPEGGKITLRVRNVGHFVNWEVSDTGIGIPPQKQSTIFDLSVSTRPQGAGFGLWSARRNALKNHGDLKVKSQPGEGSTFTLRLPKVEAGNGRIS